ncbi:MAG: peptide deformylase [Campylobacterales bacterium]|nr:peptide deformylase [Campylobacterales bacterium]
MIREILTYPNRKLHQKSTDVKIFDSTLHELLDDMYETMIAKNGVGLAAIQIGVPLNILIINPIDNDGNQKKEDLLEVINPTILEKSGEIVYNEGCLSVPKFYEDVIRASYLKVEFLNRYGETCEIIAEDFLAVAFQHEIDHLNGKLFIERLTMLKRKKFEKEQKKISKPKR